jgi:serine/threonine protein kinase
LVKGCKALFDKEIIHRDLNIKNVLIHYPSMELKADELQRFYYENTTFGRKYTSRLSKLMLQSLEETPFTVKIADLGYARQLKVDGYAESFLGTP